MLWFFLVFIYTGEPRGLAHVITSPTKFETEAECLAEGEEMAWTRRMVLPKAHIRVECLTEEEGGMMG